MLAARSSKIHIISCLKPNRPHVFLIVSTHPHIDVFFDRDWLVALGPVCTVTAGNTLDLLVRVRTNEVWDRIARACVGFAFLRGWGTNAMKSRFQHIVGPTHEEVTDVEYDGACHRWRRDEMTRLARVLHFEASACILWVLEE